MCECSVAVANALKAVRDRVDFVTMNDHGGGAVELVEKIMDDDLDSIMNRVQRTSILLGKERDHPDKLVRLCTRGNSILVAGPSGTGKSTIVSGILERFAEHGYQFCLFDPEGDYENFSPAISLGGPTSHA